MSRTFMLAASAALLLVNGCMRAEKSAQQPAGPPAAYFDNASHPDAWSGGARKITISTPKGPHQLWIKRVGNTEAQAAAADWGPRPKPLLSRGHGPLSSG
ncbi:MAG: hypothetical protein ACJ8FR_13120 [Sphingomonas sp.]